MKEITPYLNFDGNCREAMTFYQRCLGGELNVMTFGEAGFDSPPELARSRAPASDFSTRDTHRGS